VVIAMLVPEIAMLVAVLVAKVTMNLAVLPTRQPIGVCLGVLIAEGIVIVVMLVAQLLMLRGLLPVALIPPILIVGHRRNANAKRQSQSKRSLTEYIHDTSPHGGEFWPCAVEPLLKSLVTNCSG
jgi:uracil phosphoribosyltransferase